MTSQYSFTKTVRNVAVLGAACWAADDSTMSGSMAGVVCNLEETSQYLSILQVRELILQAGILDCPAASVI